MTVKEMKEKLIELEKEGKGDFKVFCIWTDTDEDGEEYNIKEEAFLYDSCIDEVWVMY